MILSLISELENAIDESDRNICANKLLLKLREYRIILGKKADQLNKLEEEKESILVEQKQKTLQCQLNNLINLVDNKIKENTFDIELFSTLRITLELSKELNKEEERKSLYEDVFYKKCIQFIYADKREELKGSIKALEIINNEKKDQIVDKFIEKLCEDYHSIYENEPTYRKIETIKSRFDWIKRILALYDHK